jgi:hypothetical protein
VLLITRTIAVVALLCFVTAAANSAPVPVGVAKNEKELGAVKEKLRGMWRGGGCEGQITFQSDGTYEWNGIGPGGSHHSGTWFLRGDSAKPTLVMQSKKGQDYRWKENTAELTVVRVDEKEFEFKFAGKDKDWEYVFARETETGTGKRLRGVEK